VPRGLFMDKAESLVIEHFEAKELKDNEIRIKSEISAIKHGTDLHILSGKSPFQNMTFDLDLRMFVEKPGVGIEHAGKRPFGNTTVGTVIEVGKQVTKYKVGEKVFSYGPIAETINVSEDNPYLEHLVDPMTATDALCMDPAYFAYGAIRDAGAKPGDNVVVSGMGAIGLFIIQFLKLSGCLNIIAVDPLEKRRILAQQYGATAVLDPTQCNAALEIRNILGGKGADIAIEASGHYPALREALRCVQQCAKVVTVGYYKGKDTDLALGMEWHHNQLSLISSLPVWGNPMREYPLWNEGRVRKTLTEMFKRKMITSENLIDPIVAFEHSPEAIMEVYRNPSQSNKLAVTYEIER
jgi:threonine dehydrogenase-like Zn-dependent dehydrogenase